MSFHDRLFSLSGPATHFMDIEAGRLAGVAGRRAVIEHLQDEQVGGDLPGLWRGTGRDERSGKFFQQPLRSLSIEKFFNMMDALE